MGKLQAATHSNHRDARLGAILETASLADRAGGERADANLVAKALRPFGHLADKSASRTGSLRRRSRQGFATLTWRPAAPHADYTQCNTVWSEGPRFFSAAWVAAQSCHTFCSARF